MHTLSARKKERERPAKVKAQKKRPKMTYTIKNKLEKHLQTNAIVLQHCNKTRDTTQSASCENAVAEAHIKDSVHGELLEGRVAETCGEPVPLANKGVLLGW